MIRPLILTSGFLTELGDVFDDPAFLPTKSRSATPSEPGCFRRADAPATVVHKPTPNFAVGWVSIPRPLLPRCGSTRHPALEIEVRVEPFTKGHGDSRCKHCEPENAALVADSAVTNARCAALHGLPVGPVPLSTAPVPLRKPRARHERAFAGRRKCGGLPSAARRRDVPLRLRFATRYSAPSAPLSPLADPRPKLQADLPRAARRSSACRSNNSRVRTSSAARADSFGNAVRYSRTSILLPKPSIA